MSKGVRVMWMRGGTSKGGMFLADDLPLARDAFLMGIMGSPDPRQIDGLGGADPLTSKVAVVGKSTRKGVDVDYLFLQVSVDKASVSDAQNCGNMLAAVGPFAIERGLVKAQDGRTIMTVFMENTGQTARLLVHTPKGEVTYAGAAQIDGVPGTAAPVEIAFQDVAGSLCGALLPTWNPCDIVDGVTVTCIDNGMPIVLIRAKDVGITGKETRAELEANAPLRTRLEKIRLLAGPLMNLGGVLNSTVPKMTLISPPDLGGVIATRSFIPHRCHASIGVMAAVSVASACVLEGSVCQGLAEVPSGNPVTLRVEHPLGETTIIATLGDGGAVQSTAILRTARKLFDGEVFAP